MQKQVLVIHGGETFESYDDYLTFLKNYQLTEGEFLQLGNKSWKYNLQSDLGDNFKVILPRMPHSWNAKYIEWKIWFDKFIPHLESEIILIGISLGGIFLAKYLSENKLPVKIKQLHLVATPFGNNEDSSGKTEKYNLVDFNLSSKLFAIEKQVESIFFYYSMDDPCVPFGDLDKYTKELPNAKKIVFNDRGHFNIEEFPEIIKNIKN